jgi:aminoglycoside phosphotransferase (APT) family kinase protein
MRISDTRDLDSFREGFTRWLRARGPRHREVVVGSIERPDAGLSAETLFVDVRHADPGGAWVDAEYVVRMPPVGEGLFPSYDLAGQAGVQHHLSQVGIPAVDPVAYEDDPGWVGAPFLVMARVEGRTLRNDAPFLRTGWLAEATPDAQARLHSNFLAVLAALHAMAWDAPGWDVPSLRLLLGTAGPALPARLLPHELARWSEYLAWAAEGSVPAPLEEACAWCTENLPANEPPPSVLWGDVQFGNAVVGHEMEVAAVLDFELASVGPAELDVAWFRVLHSMTVTSCGGDLPGFPDADEALARYERGLGRSLEDLRWYEVFAAVRSGAIMVRAARLLARMGIDDTWLTDGNPVMELVGELVRRASA